MFKLLRSALRLLRPSRPTKVLFLDIDGVILSGEELWGSGDHRYIPEQKIAHLNRIVAETDTFVVVSSVWKSDANCREQLVAGGFTGHFHADWRTGDEGHAPHRRGMQIAAWLSRHPDVSHYAIVDDDSDMLPEQMPYFVKTRFTIGLMTAETDRLIAILNGGPASSSSEMVAA